MLKKILGYDSILNPKIKGTGDITSFYKLSVKTKEGYSNFKLNKTDSESIKDKSDLKNGKMFIIERLQIIG